MYKPIKSTVQKLPPINDHHNSKIIQNIEAKLNKHNLHTAYVQDVENSKRSRKNKALSFSKYPDRKDVKRWINPVISYLNDIDYLSNPKGIDFGKIKPRNENELIDFKTLNNPAVGYYKPNYDFVMKSPVKSVKFKPKDEKRSESSNKHFMIQKLWRSYENPPEYQLVKF